MMTAHPWLWTAVVAFLALGGVQSMCEAQSDRQQFLEPWASNTDPTDVAKQHVEEVTSGRQEYAITQGGTMDGRNCRSPMSVGMNMEGAIEQTWESNRLVRMENVGDTNVVNPWLSNGRNDFRTADEIVKHAIDPGMTDREKAMAIWFQECRYRYHGRSDPGEDADPVKIYNVYACYQCGSNTSHFAELLNRAGLKVSFAGGSISHTTSRVFFDDAWHYLDANQQTMFLLRDNKTVADEPDVVRDHDLIKRAHTMGILLGDYRPPTRASPPSSPTMKSSTANSAAAAPRPPWT